MHVTLKICFSCYLSHCELRYWLRYWSYWFDIDSFLFQQSGGDSPADRTRRHEGIYTATSPLVQLPHIGQATKWYINWGGKRIWGPCGPNIWSGLAEKELSTNVIYPEKDFCKIENCMLLDRLKCFSHKTNSCQAVASILMVRSCYQ